MTLTAKADNRDKDDAEYERQQRQYRKQTKQYRQQRKNGKRWNGETE